MLRQFSISIFAATSFMNNSISASIVIPSFKLLACLQKPAIENIFKKTAPIPKNSGYTVSVIYSQAPAPSAVKSLTFIPISARTIFMTNCHNCCASAYIVPPWSKSITHCGAASATGDIIISISCSF